MATIQLPSLPALGIDPAAGDLLLIRSGGVDWKVDYDDLVPVRDDTANTFTALNAFSLLATFNGNIETDAIASIGVNYTEMSSNIKTDNIDSLTGDTVAFDQKISVADKATLTDDVDIETTGSGTKALFASDNINVAILPEATSSANGVVELATSAEIIAGTGALQAVTPTGLAGAVTSGTHTLSISGTVYNTAGSCIEIAGFKIQQIHVDVNPIKKMSGVAFVLSFTLQPFMKAFSGTNYSWAHGVEGTSGASVLRETSRTAGTITYVFQDTVSGTAEWTDGISLIFIGI